MKLWMVVVAMVASSPAMAETRRSYAGVKQELARIAADSPAAAALFELGATDGNQNVIGLKIGSGPTRNLVVATHHGNEYGSAEVALAFAESLAKEPLGDQTLYVIPVLNITGYDARRRGEPDARGHTRDPNRDYPGPCGTDGPFHLKSTRALADFVEKNAIVNAATLHTHYPAVVYPWGLSTPDLETPYRDTFHRMASDATEESRYEIGNSTEVIYPADGTFEDYAFWKHGTWAMLFELGFSHSPSDTQIQEMIRVNVPGMRRMLANSPKMPAPDHEFRGRCDLRLQVLDKRDE